MDYSSWFKQHAVKHKLIVNKLIKNDFSKEQIIDYFDFDNMINHEVDFCPLYENKQKCHDIKSLNCYLCACPNFRFNDKGIKKVDNNTQYSYCAISSKDGKLSLYGDSIHQDCSNCEIPHHKIYIEKKFNFDWKVIMNKSKINK